MLHRSSSPLRWVNVCAFALMVLVNGLAGSTTIIGGRNTAQISDANPTLITLRVTYSLFGASFTSCWGSSPSIKPYLANEGNISRVEISWLFVVSWHNEHGVALPLAVNASRCINCHDVPAAVNTDPDLSPPGNRQVEDDDPRETRCSLAFSVYLGWITIASIANVAVTLVSIGWAGFGIGPTTWATLVVAVVSPRLGPRSGHEKGLGVRAGDHLGPCRHYGQTERISWIVTLTQAGAALVAVASAATLLTRLRRL